MHTQVGMQRDIHVCIHMSIYAYRYVYIDISNTYAALCMCMYAHTCCVHICVFVCVYMYIHSILVHTRKSVVRPPESPREHEEQA